MSKHSKTFVSCRFWCFFQLQLSNCKSHFHDKIYVVSWIMQVLIDWKVRRVGRVWKMIPIERSFSIIDNESGFRVKFHFWSIAWTIKAFLREFKEKLNCNLRILVIKSFLEGWNCYFCGGWSLKIIIFILLFFSGIKNCIFIGDYEYSNRGRCEL